jgi:hypothetical protein
MLAILLMLQACASNIERHPVPEGSLAGAGIPGIPDARITLTTVTVNSDENAMERFRGIYEKINRLATSAEMYPDFLAISGGGAEGAFTAGLLNGWTENGTRPVFQVVSGVSTGALIAPYAFLGSEYDDLLKILYTTSDTKTIMDRLGIFSIRKKSALADTAPLREIIASSVNDEFLARVAAEHDKGRRLIVATTNLDSQTPVVWNLGAIAKSNLPHAPQLFRDVMLASASIPGVFPPVIIEVEANGQRYDEMHVDGGVSKQVFAYPPGMNIAALEKQTGMDIDLNLYMIRNSKVLPEHDPVEMKLTDIAAASASMLLRSQGNSNISETYEATQRDGIAFRLAYIPAEFDEEATEAFDPVYMKKLYNLAYELAVNGDPWSEHPPWYSNEIREILFPEAE